MGIIAILFKMDDFSIVRDEYFFIKEKAFKAIHEIQKSNLTKAINEDNDRVKKNKKHMREQADQKSKSQNHKSKKRPVSRHIKCPVHSCDMKAVYLDTILIDYCPICYGIWLDFGELERLLNKKIERNQLFKDKLTRTISREEDNTIIKNCPVCSSALQKKKHFLSDLYIDICRICGGIWLDSGEFAVLYLDNKKESSVQNILAGVVGNYIDIKI